MNGMGGVFYQVAQPDVLIVDMGVQPTSHTQSDLRSEIGDFEDLMELDYNYCCAVEGVCQESKLWVARNQNKTGLQDADLQRFKNVAWNECVVKKFLVTKEGDANLVGESMMSIVQALNLQWNSLQVMGLHPKIEAAEKQVIMSCMEKGFIPYELDVGKIARSFRRCDHFCDFFANAVGAQIVANTGRTPGLSKTMYGTDMDYAYKDKALFFFESSLQRFKHIVPTCLTNSDNADYIERLSQLKVVQKPPKVNLHKEPVSERDPVSVQYPVQAPQQSSEHGNIVKKITEVQLEVAQLMQVVNQIAGVVNRKGDGQVDATLKDIAQRMAMLDITPRLNGIDTQLQQAAQAIAAVDHKCDQIAASIRELPRSEEDPMDEEGIPSDTTPVMAVPRRTVHATVAVPKPADRDPSEIAFRGRP
jgi:hypothetical protein